ncbi:ABC transporter permease [Actinomadura hibisca]|uniref:Transport permease protein n=1 Tax=Actinomadura hibisca TaxID=68565 RepID=A1YZ60_9ACTN|nr:ABC transporter permease [Actinomadura hibisca]ABM21745.1 PdmR2 [Actinomadura hibisca]
MSTIASQSWFMTARLLRGTVREPLFLIIGLVQPAIWLLIFGQLFYRVTDLQGFGDGRPYLDYLTPGVVVMMALTRGAWSGGNVLEELDHGVLDRFLVSPVSRAALIAGHLCQQAITIMAQAVLVLGLALAMGARFAGGPVGALVLLLAAILMVLAVGSLSMSFALVIRRSQSLTAVIQFVLLPLVFLSSAFMDQSLAAGWIRTIARFNPIDWAVLAGRSALAEHPDWQLIGTRLLWLAVLAALCALVAVRSFRSYQRSL